MSKMKHARDYLIDFTKKKSTKDWMVFLIDLTLKKNGILDESDIKLTYDFILTAQHLKEGKNQLSAIDSKLIPSSNTETTKSLTLSKLTHKSGVNALQKNAEVCFSPNCTIFYGKNGTGKSSYFRILNELSGGNNESQIVENVQSKETSPFEVIVNYKINNDQKEQSFTWNDKTKRGIDPFTSIAVFDAKYSRFFLQERENKVNVEPFGLNLFRSIVVAIEDLRKRFDLEISSTTSSLPDLSILIKNIKQPNLTQIFSNQLTTQIIESIQELFIFSPENDALLKTKKKLLKDLTNSHKDVIIEYHNKEIKQINEFLNILKTKQIEFKKLKVDTDSAIREHNNYRTLLSQNDTFFSKIKAIPLTNSESWRNLIIAGEKHNKHLIKNNIHPSKCIYCQQPLSDDASKLIKYYQTILENDIQNELENTKSLIRGLTTKIEGFQLPISLGMSFEESEKELLSKSRDRVHKIKSILLSSLEHFKETDIDLDPHFSEIISFFERRVRQLQDKVKQLSDEDQSLKNQINKLQQEIDCLADNEFISNSKNTIISYCEKLDKINKLRSISNSLNTNSISKLSGKAEEDLITEALKRSLNIEVNKLFGTDEFGVYLEKSRTKKGSVMTKLFVQSHDASKILSEGEQKAVSLALFISELKTISYSHPIIFDDPVTSLDHEIADNLAKTIIDLSQEKQIVVFTHDKLFNESLNYWATQSNISPRHLCKTYGKGCNGKGAHITPYIIRKESINKTGCVFENKNKNLKFYIQHTKTRLKENFLEPEIASLLKFSIECFIDESLLLNTQLIKDSGKKSSIPWDKLKRISIDSQLVDETKKIWDYLSSYGSHLSMYSSNIPLTYNEAIKIINFLEKNYHK